MTPISLSAALYGVEMKMKVLLLKASSTVKSLFDETNYDLLVSKRVASIFPLHRNCFQSLQVIPISVKF
jgi:hypothetical protein